MFDDDSSSVGGGGGASDAYRKHLNRQLGIPDDDEELGQAQGGSSPQKGAGGGSSYYVAEIQRLREALSTTSQGPVEAKYLEQVKRNRDLIVKLESERSKVSKLTARIVAMEREKIDADKSSELARGIGLPSQRVVTGNSLSTVASSRIGSMETVPEPSLEDRLEKANKNIQTQRKTIDDLKRDNTRIRRVLQLEIGGDEDSVENALKSLSATADATPAGTITKATAPTAGWKGRAQQIAILKGKLKDMERALRGVSQPDVVQDSEGIARDDDETMSVRTGITTRTGVTAVTSTSTVRDFEDVNRTGVEVRQKRSQLHAREMQVKIEEKARELDEERKKNESYQARLQILERDNQHLRNCLQRMIEKTENDDKLIAAYKNELEEKRNEVRRAATAGSSSRGSLVTGITDKETIDRLERENGKLLDLVAEMRSNIAKGGSASVAKNMHAWSAPANVMEMIEEQRRTILALETQLQRRDKVTSSQMDTVKGIDEVLRDENNALKFRIKAVSEMMNKEIALHQAMAAEKVAAVQAASAAMSAATGGYFEGGDDDEDGDGSGGMLPPIHGSRPTSNASSTARAKKSNSIRKASTSSSAPSKDDFESLKRQYDELKRAFNSQQSKAFAK